MSKENGTEMSPHSHQLTRVKSNSAHE